MKTIVKSAAGWVTALVLGVALAAPANAQDVSVIGKWQTKDRDASYQTEMCGADNTRLCIRLVELHGKGDKARNRAYLGKLLVDKARPVSQVRWRGKIDLMGQTADATFTLRSANTLEVSGCAYVVVCDSFNLTRVE